MNAWPGSRGAAGTEVVRHIRPRVGTHRHHRGFRSGRLAVAGLSLAAVPWVVAAVMTHPSERVLPPLADAPGFAEQGAPQEPWLPPMPAPSNRPTGTTPPTRPGVVASPTTATPVVLPTGRTVVRVMGPTMPARRVPDAPNGGPGATSPGGFGIEDFPPAATPTPTTCPTSSTPEPSPTPAPEVPTEPPAPEPEMTSDPAPEPTPDLPKAEEAPPSSEPPADPTPEPSGG